MNLEKIKLANTKIIGKQIEYYKVINSTHIYAKKIANLEENNGKIIIAKSQTDGIGTNGRSWHTGANNIAMTIILKPRCELKDLRYLTVEIANAVQISIKKLYDIDLKIKKPNDLLLNNKKICGILTEVSTISGKINYLLISIGFNVNETEFSKETIEIATSLKKEYNKTFETEEIIKKIIENLETKIEL